MTVLIVLGILATGGLMGGFGVFLCMRVVLQRSEKRAEERVMQLNRELDASVRLGSAYQEKWSEDRAKDATTIADLKAQLEAKNTKPAEPRRIRARSMSEAAQMAEDAAAKEQR